MEANGALKRFARVVVGTAIIFAVLGAFLQRVIEGESVEAWLVFLVSVFGLAAAAVILGPEAVRVAHEVLQGGRERP